MAPRGNDAIPSWSGFNYQGKMTLLVSLIEINALLSQGKSLDNCYVEIEKTEDFIIYIHGVAVGLYQVKAYLSKTAVSNFTGAMQKLLDHRNAINAQGASCFLCTPLEINDWRKEENTYQNTINLFKYKNSHVHVVDTPSDIQEELTILLSHLDIPTARTIDLYLGLCQMLDENISRMHNEDFKRRNYNIMFQDILTFFNDRHISYVASSEARKKEEIYEYIVGNIKDAIEDYCKNECDNAGICSEITMRNTCALPKSYDYILEIDIFSYCKYLNPHHTDWDHQFNYIGRLGEDSIQRLLIPIFSLLKSDSLHVCDNCIYCDSDVYDTSEKRVVPTLLSFPFIQRRKTEDDIDRSISNILDKIKKNAFLASSSVVGCTITGDTRGKIYDTNKKSILYFDSDEENYEYQKITSNGNYIKVIDFEDFISKIGE